MDGVWHGDPAIDVATDNDGDDANTHLPLVSSSFTAINHRPTQLLTPESSAAASVRPDQTPSRTAGSQGRWHNPNVARYLGLGSTVEPAHLEKFAPRTVLPDSPHIKPVRKRRRLTNGERLCRGTDAFTKERDISTQQLVSEDLGVREAPSNTKVSRVKTALYSNQPFSTQPSSTAHDSDTDTPVFDCDVLVNEDIAYPQDVSCVAPGSIFRTETVRTASQDSQDAVDAPYVEDSHISLLDLEEDNELGVVSDGHCNLLSRDNNNTTFSGDDYDFDITDDDLLTLISGGTCFDGPQSVSSSVVKCDDTQGHLVEPYCEDAPGEAPAVSSPQHTLKKFVSPVTLTTRLLAADSGDRSAEARKPIVRPLFPNLVRDRSPIIGLSSNTLLRTCFRIGEAINQSSQAAKSGQHVIIELYARVLASERTNKQQYFTFCDLFHTKPPYIKGAYDAAIWKAVQLFEYDSRRLLQQGRMCRCIGTMKRSGKERIMAIHNIWEATWEDIEWVEGIVRS